MAYCKYCNKVENEQYSPCLECQVCNSSVHIECLKKKTPGNFLGDVFFIYTCSECSQNGEEIFDRGKMTWLNCLTLVMYDLTSKCSAISKHGFFHWRTHIGSFIHKNWHYLFHPQFKKRKNWAGTFSGTLSHYSPLFFQSGANILNEPGWWKLTYKFTPALMKYLNAEISVIKQKEKPLKLTNAAEKDTDYAIMTRLLSEIGLTNLLLVENEKRIPVHIQQENPCKKLKLEETTGSYSLSQALPDNDNYTFRNEQRDSTMDDYFSNYFFDGEDSISDLDGILPDFEDLSECSSTIQFQNEEASMQDTNDQYNNYLSSGEYGDSDSTSQFGFSNSKFNSFSEESNDSKLGSNFINQKSKNSSSFLSAPVIKSLFNENNDASDVLPWNCTQSVEQNIVQETLVPATEYEEIQILNHLNSMCRKAHHIDVDKKLVRLRAKLALRKLRRNKHLPLWDIDRAVCRLSNFPVQDFISPICEDVRVLDRFQHVHESLSGTTISPQVDFATRLAGNLESAPFLSPYSGRLLKPYIRRDTQTVPPWLQLMDELRIKVKKIVTDIGNYERAPLDYCYVRSQHIASINSLCSQHFWPGIDLTGTLQYPEFSCVVLYKKLVIAFAFLVPDVGPSEAYISFIFTRPGWRKSGIANFMLYHLIQTCIDKDITLHVSPGNPAIFLYQKFGFKIEELIQDFYEKYLAANSTECKHALALRLCR